MFLLESLFKVKTSQFFMVFFQNVEMIYILLHFLNFFPPNRNSIDSPEKTTPAVVYDEPYK